MAEILRITCVGFEQEQLEALAKIDAELDAIQKNLGALDNRKSFLSKKIPLNKKGQSDTLIKDDADPRIVRKVDREDSKRSESDIKLRDEEKSRAMETIEKNGLEASKGDLSSQNKIRDALSTLFKNDSILIDYVQEVSFDVLLKAFRRLVKTETPGRSGKLPDTPFKLSFEEIEKIGTVTPGEKIDPGPIVKQGTLEPKVGESPKTVLDELKFLLHTTTAYGEFAKKRFELDNLKSRASTSMSIKTAINDSINGPPPNGINEVDEFLEELTEKQSDFTEDDLRMKYQGENLSRVSELPGSPGSKEEFDQMYGVKNEGEEIVEGRTVADQQIEDDLFEESLIGKSPAEKTALREANESFRELERLQRLGPEREKGMNDFMNCRLAGLNDAPL
jgi:hypothetical protein